MHAFDDSAVLQFGLGHPTDAVSSEVGIARLDATETTQVLVPDRV